MSFILTFSSNTKYAQSSGDEEKGVRDVNVKRNEMKTGEVTVKDFS